MKGTVKSKVDFKDFKKLFKTFENYPFYEKWNEEDLRQEYDKFQKEDGRIFAYYIDNKCVGIVSMKKLDGEYPLKYENEKVMIVSDIIVELRENDVEIGVNLLNEAIKYAISLGYAYMFFRFKYEVRDLPPVEIAKACGFKFVWDLCQEVQHDRVEQYVRRDKSGKDLRMFMEKKL